MPDELDLDRIEGHIKGRQEWKVKAVKGQEVYIQLAGYLKIKGDRNNFAFKHILSPSKKDSITSGMKLHRRLFHRLDKDGTAKDNPHPGKKEKSESALTRSEKYGKESKPELTAIDLSIMNLDLVLVEMAGALLKATWKTNDESDIDVRFSKACVKIINRSGHVTSAFGMKIRACRLSNKAFEVFHCGGWFDAVST